ASPLPPSPRPAALGPAHRPHLFPAHDQAAVAPPPFRAPFSVEAGPPPLHPVLGPPAPCGDGPLVKALGAFAQRCLLALAWPGGVPVERHRDLEPQPGHVPSDSVTPSDRRSRPGSSPPSPPSRRPRSRDRSRRRRCARTRGRG